MHDVEILLGVNGDIMGGLPFEMVREFGEIMINFVLVFSLADDDRAGAFLGIGDVRERERGPGKEGGFFQKVTAR